MINKFYNEFKIRDYLDEVSGTINSSKVIDCSLGTNPFINSSYPDPNYSQLKNKLIETIKEDFNITLSFDNISFGTGTMGVMRNICQFMLDEGDIVLGIAPQFSRFISEVELQKGIYTYYSLSPDNNYKFVLDDFINEIHSGLKMIYIDNPNNPTGQIISINDIKKICEIAKDNDIYVLIDEAYGDYMNLNNSAINLVNVFDNLIVVKSASKVYGLPSHRVGYIITSKEIIEIYNKILVPFPFSETAMNKFIHTLNNRKKIRNKLQNIRQIKKCILDNIGADNYLHTNLETPIFTIRTDKYHDLQKELLANNILAESCSCFEGLNSQFARIRLSKEYKKILKVLVKVLS